MLTMLIMLILIYVNKSYDNLLNQPNLMKGQLSFRKAFLKNLKFLQESNSG